MSSFPRLIYNSLIPLVQLLRLIEECGVAMYCDMHAHSRRHNIFIYGCENKRSPEKRLTEQVFPLMLHKNSADRVGILNLSTSITSNHLHHHISLFQFSFESCKFKIQRSKEGTGRIVVWMLGITNAYTIEASFGGSLLGSRKGTHFNTQVINKKKKVPSSSRRFYTLADLRIICRTLCCCRLHTCMIFSMILVATKSI